MDYIAENINEIRAKIERAARNAGRDPNEVTIVGVTKTVAPEKIKAMAACGIYDAGENRVQELLAKYQAPELEGENIRWHLIGHLQTNKVKYVMDKVRTIQSVDSLKLAAEINRRTAALGVSADVLLEINVAREVSKYGVFPEQGVNFAAETLKYANLTIRGLMCVAPFVENPHDNRFFFRIMRNLFVDINNNMNDNIRMDCLSMGMTQDFEAAVEEGSTMVRIGTGIFGER